MGKIWDVKIRVTIDTSKIHDKWQKHESSKKYEKKASKNPEEVQMPAAASTAPSQSSVELINTDEKTAAVIMAIVSEKTGIPLNRLQFRSIRYTGESGKGDEEK